MPPLIAIVGSDGSGKSTVSDMLLTWMREQRPTALCHLGKQTGNIGRAIARWPLIGRRFDTAIHKTASKANDPGGPSLSSAITIFLFSMRRVRRFRRMLKLRSTGLAILTDRFPQVEVPGPMDGLGLANTHGGGPLVRALARRERRQYEWMASHRPDLVLRLNVDLETAVARKPDHRVTSLQTKIRDVALLTFGGAKIVDIDTTQPLDVVFAQAKRAVAPVLASR